MRLISAMLIAAGVLTEALAPGSAVAPGSAAGRLPSWEDPEFFDAEVPNDGIFRIAWADFDGDGLQDVLQTTLDGEVRPTPIVLLANDGAGSFVDATARVFPDGAPRPIYTSQVALVDDFNSDGRPDVFLCDFGQHGPDLTEWGYQDTLALSVGASRMRDATDNLPDVPPGTCHSAAAGDIDADGDLDIYVGNECCGEGRPFLLQNDGRGRFTALLDRLPDGVVRGPNIPASAFADVDGDGFVDLLLGGNGGPGGSVDDNWLLRNDGTGHFTFVPGGMPPKLPDGTAFVSGISSLDFTGDGALDLLVLSIIEEPEWAWHFQALVNSGRGSLADQTGRRLKGGSGPLHLSHFRVVDVDGDGRLDVWGRGWFAPILLQTGKRTFAASAFEFEDAFAGLHPDGLFALVDVDGDGGRDVVGGYDDEIDGVQRYAVFRQQGGATLPSTPQRVLATRQLRRKVVVSWEYAWGATSYEVWRSESAAAAGEMIGVSDRTWFRDRRPARGREYVYRVRALNSAGASPYSRGIAGMAR